MSTKGNRRQNGARQNNREKDRRKKVRNAMRKKRVKDETQRSEQITSKNWERKGRKETQGM